MYNWFTIYVQVYTQSANQIITKKYTTFDDVTGKKRKRNEKLINIPQRKIKVFSYNINICCCCCIQV